MPNDWNHIFASFVKWRIMGAEQSWNPAGWSKIPSIVGVAARSWKAFLLFQWCQYRAHFIACCASSVLSSFEEVIFKYEFMIRWKCSEEEASWHSRSQHFCKSFSLWRRILIFRVNRIIFSCALPISFAVRDNISNVRTKGNLEANESPRTVVSCIRWLKISEYFLWIV